MRTRRPMLALPLLAGAAAACSDEGGESPANYAGARTALVETDAVIGVGEMATSRTWPASPGMPMVENEDPREIECDDVDQDGDGRDSCSADADGDGVRASADCDDGDAAISPLEMDVPCDGLDQNCNGFDECDRDADGSLDRHDCEPDDSRIRDDCHRGGSRATRISL